MSEQRKSSQKSKSRQFRRDPANAAGSLDRCLTAVARSVVGEQRTIAQAWHMAAHAHAIRGHDLNSVRIPLLRALREQIDLFGGEPYRRRLAATEHALEVAVELLGHRAIRVVGAPAEGLAAEQDLLELVIYADEAESVLRELQDLRVPYTLDQTEYSSRRDGPKRIHPAVIIGTPTLDLRLSILPSDWARQPIFLEGQHPWTRMLPA